MESKSVKLICLLDNAVEALIDRQDGQAREIVLEILRSMRPAKATKETAMRVVESICHFPLELAPNHDVMVMLCTSITAQIGPPGKGGARADALAA